MALTTEKLNSSDEQICDGDSAETIEKNPKSWAAWKREAERLQAIIDEVANREAQPVGFRYRHSDTVSWLYNDWRWPDSVEAEQCQIEWLYTAPPAPAVPEEAKVGEMPFLGNSEQGYVRGWNACRAAMLAQPVSSDYK
ncbi:hypothetical protein ACFW1Q_13140, partial [Serratia bockelmannii]